MNIKLLVIGYFRPMRTSFWLGLLVIGLILPSILPLFRTDFFHLHDYTHVARLYEMDKALKDGHFPVRWSADLGWGYGMPLFNFYAPLPYYLAEIFHLLGFSFLNSIKICFGATFFISFAGTFLLAKKFWGLWGGLLSALAFVYSPYRAVDFYVRGALGELLAIAIIPWVLWSVFELIDKKVLKYLLLSAFFIAGLFLSHTVLTFISLPILIIIGIFYSLLNKNKLKAFCWFTVSFVLSLGLSAFFLLPAFLEKDFTRVNVLTQGFSYYGHHFLYFRQYLEGTWGYGGSVDSIPDGMAFHLGKTHLLLAVITLILAVINFWKNKKADKKISLVLFFIFLGIFLAYLATYHAKPIWDTLPIMAFIQFPWRFNSLIIVLLGFLTGGGCFYLSKIFSQKTTLIFCLLSISMILITNYHYFKPEGYLNPNDLYYTDEKLIKTQMSGVIPDYIPKWVKLDPLSIAAAEYTIISGNPTIEVLESITQKLILKVNSQQITRILLNRFYFPGWQAYINGRQLDLEYKNNNGIIGVELPEGNYLLSLELKRTGVRLIADIISLASLLIAGGLFVFRKKIF